jgi:hypothetical protein
LAGVDTTVCYYRFLIGRDVVYVDEINAPCKPSDLRYLFWSKGKQSFVQQFDDCQTYLPVKTSSAFMNQLKTGFNRLSQEKVLNPQYIYSHKDTIYKFTSYPPSHGIAIIFKIFAGKAVIEKSIRESAFGGRYVYGDDKNKHKNINYQHNLNTIQYKLKLLAEAAVRKLGY